MSSKHLACFNNLTGRSRLPRTTTRTRAHTRANAPTHRLPQTPKKKTNSHTGKHAARGRPTQNQTTLLGHTTLRRLRTDFVFCKAVEQQASDPGSSISGPRGAGVRASAMASPAVARRGRNAAVENRSPAGIGSTDPRAKSPGKLSAPMRRAQPPTRASPERS